METFKYYNSDVEGHALLEWNKIESNRRQYLMNSYKEKFLQKAKDDKLRNNKLQNNKKGNIYTEFLRNTTSEYV